MKKTVFTFFILSCLVSASLFAGGNNEQSDSGPWTPDGGVEWMVTSSPGGGSSIFTQTIVDIIKSENLVDQNIIINYKTDGGGAVGRRQVASTRNNADLTILTYNLGDLEPFVSIEGGDLDQLTPLAVMALDGQLILGRAGSDYTSYEDLKTAIESGKRLIMGGSKADDEAVYNAVKDLTGADIEYLRSDSTGEALPQLLGGHIDLVISKPAAAFDYVSSGQMVPIVAATGTRFDAPFNAPTMKELGYDFELTIWRGIVGPGNMSDDAAAYWSDVFKKVSETDAWKNNYISKFLLKSAFMGGEDAMMFMQQAEDNTNR